MLMTPVDNWMQCFCHFFLNTGTMCDCSQSLGSLPCSKDVWNMKVIAGVSSSASSFKYLACMLSGPVRFNVFQQFIYPIFSDCDILHCRIR